MGVRHPDDSRAIAPVPARAVPEPGLAERIAHDIETRLRTAETAAGRVREQVDEAAVHDLRVAIRRLNAALRLWRPLLRDRARRRARRDLRAMRRALGPIRELEVDAGLLREASADLPDPSRVAAEQLLVRLERRLRRARLEAGRAASQSRLLRLRRAVETALERLPDRVARVGDPLRSAAAQVQAAHRGARSALAAGLERGDDDLLHEARIRVKKLRYTLEGRDAIWEHSTPLDNLRDLQRTLGLAHDYAMLRDRVARRARRSREQGAVAGAAALLAVLERIESGRQAALDEVRGLATRLGPELGVSIPGPVRPVDHGLAMYLERQLAERNRALLDRGPHGAGAPPLPPRSERRREPARRRAPESGSPPRPQAERRRALPRRAPDPGPRDS